MIKALEIQTMTVCGPLEQRGIKIVIGPGRSGKCRNAYHQAETRRAIKEENLH